LAEEWRQNQKLRNDPRLTRIGAFLRRSSLDELPQLWNVFKGEMSLVGPRPIVESEIAKFGEAYSMYRRVTPGLSGLWQISGRSKTTYAERVELDTYYVRNWSVWLDIHVLMRTVWIVLRRDGAY
jgi:lipopolysaccharide/colanic/teichoic acid biosynthesis glycosyltransferase